MKVDRTLALVSTTILIFLLASVSPTFPAYAKTHASPITTNPNQVSASIVQLVAPTVIHSIWNGASPPLASITDPTTPKTPQAIPFSPYLRVNTSRAPAASTSRQSVAATTIANSFIQSDPITPTQNFTGLTDKQNIVTYYYNKSGPIINPPASEGAVGPDDYMQAVNAIFAVWAKNGTLLEGPLPNNALFNATGQGEPCGGDVNGTAVNYGYEPIVLYDSLANRWFFSYLGYPNYPATSVSLCIGVSQSGDPLGAWYLYAYPWYTNVFPDYPKYGVWPDAYYASVNDYCPNIPFEDIRKSPSVNDYCGASAIAFNRAEMLAGQSGTYISFTLNSNPLTPNLAPSLPNNDYCDFSLLPSDLNGPAPPPGTPNTFAELYFSAPPQFTCPFNGLMLWNFAANFLTPSASSFTSVATLTTAPFNADVCDWGNNLACVPEERVDGNNWLAAISDRLMYRLQYRNFGTYSTLVTQHTVNVTLSGTSILQNETGIQWFELRNYGSGWSIYQQGTYNPDSNWRWMGSIAMDDAGNIALCYSVSGSFMYPSIACTGRYATDPLGQMTIPEFQLLAGSGSQLDSGNIWGDFSTLTLDPVDGVTFWYTQEYYSTTSSGLWNTQIASFYLSIPIALATGWNLISLPVVPTNTATSSLLAALIAKGEVTIVWGYTGSPASWKSYKPGPPATGTLLSMNDGHGYWIYMTTPDTLFVSGAIIPTASTSPAYPLNKGWNLIGFKPQPTVQSESVNQYLSSISGEYDQNSVWVYDNSSGSWTRAGASYMLEPGQGMWILTTVAVTLVP